MKPGIIVGACIFSWPQTCVSCCTCIPHQTFPCWSAGTRRKVGQACAEKARNIFRICLFTSRSAYPLAGKTLSFHFWPYLVLRNFFFCRKLYPSGQELFPSMWCEIDPFKKAKNKYLYMDATPIFQNVLSLSQTWMFHCSNVSTVKQVQRVPFGWCYKSMQMFFALNIMLAIMDKSKPQCPKSLRHLCVFMLPNILS